MDKNSDTIVQTRTIHEAVVQGVLQVLLYMNRESSAGRAPRFPVAMQEGMRGVLKHGQPSGFSSHTFIIEFVKDGVINLDDEAIGRVKRGDYSHIWKMTNSYLERFGIAPIEPMPVAVALAP